MGILIRISVVSAALLSGFQTMSGTNIVDTVFEDGSATCCSLVRPFCQIEPELVNSSASIEGRRFNGSAGPGHGEFLLGWMYHHGRGFPADHAKAVEWYGQAAEMGHEEARAGLKSICNDTAGVPRVGSAELDAEKYLDELERMRVSAAVGTMGVMSEEDGFWDWLRDSTWRGPAYSNAYDKVSSRSSERNDRPQSIRPHMVRENLEARAKKNWVAKLKRALRRIRR